MIVEPGDPDREVLVAKSFHEQTDEELTKKETKDLHQVDYTQLYDFLKMNQEEVNELRAERLAKTHDPLALMANSQSPYIYLIAQPGMNIGQDRQMHMVGGNGGNLCRQYDGQNAENQIGYNARHITGNQNGYNVVQNVRNQVVQMAVRYPGIQNVGNQNGLIVVPRIANHNANQNGNVNVVAERAEGNEAGDIDKIEKVNAKCILMANLKQALTSGTQTDKAPVYNSDGSVELFEPITKPHPVQQNTSNVIIAEPNREHNGGTVEQHPATVEETRAYFESLYNNLVTKVEKFNMINCKMKEINANLTTELARFKGQEKCFEFNQEKFDKLESSYTKSVNQEQCLTKKINTLHLSPAKPTMTLNEEIANLNNQLSKEKSILSYLQEERKKLKYDFKTRKSELLDKLVESEKTIKELNNILVKMGQSIQTMHMLSPKLDSFYHTKHKMALDKHDPPAVYDLEETLQLAQESQVFISQKAKSREELYFKNTFKMASVSNTVSKPILIPDDRFSDNASLPSVARKFLNEVKDTIVTLQRVAKSKMTLNVNNWLSTVHHEQFLNEAAKFVRDFKSLAKEANESLDMNKVLEYENQCLLRVVLESLKLLQRQLFRSLEDWEVSSLQCMQRVNHQNKLTHPHPQRNFVPTVVATKSGLVQVNAAKQSSPRAAASISTARHISTVSIKPKVNAASPIKYYYFKAHSPLRRPFNQKSVAKTNNFNKKVYTAKVNNVTIAGPEIVVSTAERKRENAVESSACWIWRPTGKVIDHISKDSGSYMPKRFDYVDPQGRLKKISVLFTATDFMLYLVTLRYWIESQVLLNVPRQNNMYSFVLIILCLREGKPVRGLPLKLFENDHTCVACQKGKHHKASCKPKLVCSIREPLQMLHMDLFGPTSVRSTNHKTYCLVVTDDYSRTRKVEENLHINFLENKPNVAGSGPEWLFDIDSLTKSMNYEPITAGNQTNGNAGIETNVNAGQARQEKASDHEYILLPLMLSNSPLSSSSQSTDNKDADEVPGKGDDDLSERNGQDKEGGTLNKENDHNMQDFRAELDNLLVQQKEGFDNVDDQERIDSSTQDVNTVRPSINTASENINTRSSNINTASPIPNDPSMQSCYIKKQRETKSQRLSKTAYLLVFSLTIQKPNGIQALTDPSWIEAIQEELLQFILQKLECESTFLYGTIEEEVYACQPPGFKDPQFPDKVYKEEGTIDKLCSSRRTKMMHKRFQMSSIGELTFFLGLQVQQKEDGIFISQDKDSPFDLEAFSNSDYAGASLDRKSTTGAEYVLLLNCVGKNPVFHSKTKQIVNNGIISLVFLIEKKFDQVIKIYTNHNVTDLLTKAFDVSRFNFLIASIGLLNLLNEIVIKELEDRMERAATISSSLEAEQDNGNINRTQSIATLNESLPQGTSSGSGPRYLDTILEGVEAQIRFEAASKQSNDPPLSRVNTLGSGEDNMKLKDLMEFCTKLSVRALDL
ncbi:hypothetical protein Tco_1402803 [Tanacetum coccineum]